jgi:hemerythrin
LAELIYEILVPGISWLEIPKLDLRVLCGCPADAVKHLTSKGKISILTENGATFETGPNAILLADDFLQNGLPANMSEFPVLQMFYKQGQIIPNHPNNKGERPILIGNANAVQSQIQYIYRGNYGLTTPEELIDCGVSLQDTAEMMAMKMQFAFGRIQPANALLATCVVKDSGWHSLKEDLLVSRKGMNQYQFKMGTECIDVDLRLREGETYPPPYKLPDQLLPRDKFSVWHVGEGDGWDCYRPCMASMLMIDGEPYLVDAGPNVHYTLEVLGIDLSEVAGIFQTHAHDDHFAGLPYLLQGGSKIKFFASSLVRKSTFQKLSDLISLPVEEIESFFEIVDLEFDNWTNVTNLVEVQPRFSPHPVETNIYYFRYQEGSETKVFGHLADIISSVVLGRMKNPEAKYHISEDFFDKTLQSYLEHSDVKKIDAGGGMIHGEVDDFVKDPSEKLILAHSSLPFSENQLTSACTAEFGTVDLRVPLDHEKFFHDKALHWLQQQLPTLKKEDLKELITQQTEEISRGQQVLVHAQEAGYIPLLLTGRVKQNGLLYPMGTLLGEAHALRDLPVSQEMVSVGPVRFLPIFLDPYRELLKKHKLMKKRISLLSACDHLRTFPMLQYGLCDDQLNSLLKQSERISLKKDQPVLIPNNTLGVLESGEVRFLAGNNTLKVTEKSVLGLSSILGKPLFWKEQTAKKCQVLCLPAENLMQAPGVRWFLQRTYQNYNFQLSS